jgi:hypothetical protein
MNRKERELLTKKKKKKENLEENESVIWLVFGVLLLPNAYCT